MVLTKDDGKEIALNSRKIDFSGSFCFQETRLLKAWLTFSLPPPIGQYHQKSDSSGLVWGLISIRKKASTPRGLCTLWRADSVVGKRLEEPYGVTTSSRRGLRGWNVLRGEQDVCEEMVGEGMEEGPSG